MVAPISEYVEYNGFYFPKAVLRSVPADKAAFQAYRSRQAESLKNLISQERGTAWRSEQAGLPHDSVQDLAASFRPVPVAWETTFDLRDAPFVSCRDLSGLIESAFS